MAKNVLVLERDDQGRFFLLVNGTNLALGGAQTHAEVVLRDLHISRIRCEVEVEDQAVVVNEAHPPPGSQAIRRQLRPGEDIHIGHARLRLEAPAPEEQPPAAPAASEAPATTGAGRQLLVVEGANEGRAFPLPARGTVSLGKHSKYADIVLHDLHVSRVHCQLQIEAGKVVVTHREGDNGTLINGDRISGPQELRLGEVLRVGNSQLRLEAVPVEDSTAAEEGFEVIEDEGSEVEVVEAVITEEDVPGAPRSPKPRAGATPPARSPTDRLLPLEGQVFGRYRLGQVLGRGHSGVVFRAQDLKSNVVVALKVLLPEFPASGTELEHFVGSLKVVPQLPHANLVSLYGAGRSGAHCWIAREHVEGESLAGLVQRMADTGKFSWTAAARLAVHLGRALAFLHQRKIAHGNLTPANVLIRASDKVTKLNDLMLGKALEGSQLLGDILERKLLAELPYLAPEQVDPEAFIDHLADLYGLGAVLYCALTGRPPFTGQTPADILEQVRQTPAVRPSNYQRGIPPALEGVVLKLLAKHQEDRYQTPAELLNALAPIVQEHQVPV